MSVEREVYIQRNTDEGRVWWEIGIQTKRWSEGKKHLNWILKMHSYSSGLLGDMCYKQRTAEKIFGSLQWYVGDGICLKWIDGALYGMELIEKENINIPCLNVSYKETLVIYCHNFKLFSRAVFSYFLMIELPFNLSNNCPPPNCPTAAPLIKDNLFNFLKIRLQMQFLGGIHIAFNHLKF